MCGVLYILIVGKTEEEDPIFGSVCRVLVSAQEVYFELEQMEAFFCQHYHAFALSSLSIMTSGLYHCPNISNTLSSQYTVL